MLCRHIQNDCCCAMFSRWCFSQCNLLNVVWNVVCANVFFTYIFTYWCWYIHQYQPDSKREFFYSTSFPSTSIYHLFIFWTLFFSQSCTLYTISVSKKSIANENNIKNCTIKHVYEIFYFYYLSSYINTVHTYIIFSLSHTKNACNLNVIQWFEIFFLWIFFLDSRQ